MAKRYKIKQAVPRWKDISEAIVRSAFDYEKYMMDNHGYERKKLVGSIGYGKKTHMFSTVCKIEGDTIYIADCMSLCGSAKWSSFLNIYIEQEKECDCKRCMPKGDDKND